jgi:hypothetical protein
VTRRRPTTALARCDGVIGQRASWRSYSSWRRIHCWDESPSSRPFGALSRIEPESVGPLGSRSVLSSDHRTRAHGPAGSARRAAHEGHALPADSGVVQTHLVNPFCVLVTIDAVRVPFAVRIRRDGCFDATGRMRHAAEGIWGCPAPHTAGSNR